MIRYGVIGCGAIHATHCKAIGEVDGAELVGLYDVDSEKAAAAAELQHSTAFDTLDRMWEAVDAVTICVPSGHHADTSLLAAKAGKHILCEKPIDVHLLRAVELVTSCDKWGVTLGVISQHRFAPDVLRLKSLIEQGAFGSLLQADVIVKWYRTQSYYDSASWRGTLALDGGCLMNQAIHYIDLAQWLVGGVASVRGTVRTMSHNIEAEDTAVATVEYLCGTVGFIHATTNAFPGFAERIEIHGTNGSAILEADALKFLGIDENAAASGFYGKGIASQPVPPEQTVHASGPADNLWDLLHRLQIEDFTRALEEGCPPLVTGRDALAPLAIVRAIYESSALKGTEVKVTAL